jgi:hypothetical protein
VTSFDARKGTPGESTVERRREPAPLRGAGEEAAA